MSVLNYVNYATEKRGKIVKRLSCESDERGPIRYIGPQEKLTDRIDEYSATTFGCQIRNSY